MALKLCKTGEQDDAPNLAENLRALLKSKNTNATQLAQALEIPMMTIRRLLSGETTDPRLSTLKMVADYFNISIDSLVGKGNTGYLKTSSENNLQFIPLLDWKTASSIVNLKDIDLNTWENWQSVSLDEKNALSKNAFALESRPSMYPRFPQGTVFVIDPDVPPTDGDFVLVKIISDDELTLRELRIDPPEWQLHPLVPGNTVLQYSKKQNIISGVVLLTLLFNRRLYD